MTKNQAANKVFDMLSFQYKPLETKMLKMLKDNDMPELIKKYNNAGTAKKIAILDHMAQYLGL